jgi:hypothetical protein
VPLDARQGLHGADLQLQAADLSGCGRASGGECVKLGEWQRIAIENWTLIPEEQARPIFAHRIAAGSLVLTARAGWG